MIIYQLINRAYCSKYCHRQLFFTMTPQRFKEIRKELGLTQVELAKKLGLATNGNVTIRRIETEKANPSGLICKALEFFYLLSKTNQHMLISVPSHNFKKIRQELGLTQKELAKELGLSKNGDVTIRRIENGKADPSRLICKTFGSFYLLKKFNIYK